MEIDNEWWIDTRVGAFTASFEWISIIRGTIWPTL